MAIPGNLRRDLVRIAIAWERTFTNIPSITTAISEYDAAMLVGMSEADYAAAMRGSTAVLFGDLPELFRDEDELRRLWSRPDTRRKLLEGLEEKSYGGQQLAEVSKLIQADNSDLYDVLAYIAFNMPPVTHAERVEASKARILQDHDYREQDFLRFVLGHYVAQGVTELDMDKLPQLIELKYHSMGDAVAELGPVNRIRAVFVGIQRHLYGQ